MATAHYEATTNSAFLVHLLAVVDSNYDEIISQTLNEVETHLNILSNKVHARDINFLMIEVPKLDNSILDNQLIKRRHHTLLENDFEQQYDIDYLHPLTIRLKKHLYVLTYLLNLTLNLQKTSILLV